MLDSIDTLIAFGLIMAVVGLLITIFVQSVSALLNLRGQNLSRGLTETFRTIAPQTFKTASPNEATKEGKKLAKALADHLLKLPQLSDQAHFWKMATAVRPQEVFATLAKLANGEGSDQNMEGHAKNLLNELHGVADSAERVNKALADAENALCASGVRLSSPLPAIFS
jgi:hypothetical protein